jgi:hypothetical protein
METKKPIIKLLQRAVGSLLGSQGPLLPTFVQDLVAEKRPSPPPSPCTEVVVVNGFGFVVESSNLPLAGQRVRASSGGSGVGGFDSVV